MKTTFVFGIMIVLLFSMQLLAAQKNPLKGNFTKSVSGEYLVTVVEGEDRAEEKLSDFFSKFGLTSIKELSPGIFLVKLENDPGIDLLQQESAKENCIATIGKNVVYQKYR